MTARATVQIPLTQGFHAIVDATDADRVLAMGKWSAYRNGHTVYARRDVRGVDGKRAAQYLHTFLTGYTQTDHINGDGLDNRRVNLREATHAENMRNRRRQVNNTSGFVGVSRHKQKRKWEARLRVDGKKRHFGYFETAETAAHARDTAARELHGEFARLNFPDVEDVPHDPHP